MLSTALHITPWTLGCDWSVYSARRVSKWVILFPDESDSSLVRQLVAEKLKSQWESKEGVKPTDSYTWLPTRISGFTNSVSERIVILFQDMISDDHSYSYPNPLSHFLRKEKKKPGIYELLGSRKMEP